MKMSAKLGIEIEEMSFVLRTFRIWSGKPINLTQRVETTVAIEISCSKFIRVYNKSMVVIVLHFLYWY